MSCFAATWESFCLPLPDVSGYGYVVGLGLVRTRFADGSVRQRRRYWHWPRAWSVRWTIRADVLHTLEAWALAFGYEWFDMDLLSGDGSVLATHSVRLSSDLSVSAVAGGVVRVTAELEQSSGAPSADISGWSLPCLAVDGYGYSIDSGLISTPFDAASRRQSRRYTTAPRLFSAQWTLSAADLARAETWIDANGFAWFDLDLLSGESGTETPTAHRVRVASDLTVSAVTSGIFRLSCTLEQACNDAATALEAEASDNARACAVGTSAATPTGIDDAGLADSWGGL